jgi:aminomethyltransferase
MRVPLHDLHVQLGARIVPFAGWDMPVQYSSIKDEHHAVRSSCGLFDVSHMGEFVFRGSSARELLQHLTTNDLDDLPIGRCHYTFLLNDSGGTVDDAMVYRRADEDYLVVVNAGNIEKDWDHVKRISEGFSRADIQDKSSEYGLFALQGPEALDVIQSIAGINVADLAFHSLIEAKISSHTVLIATSGYTGENGVEVFVAADDVEAIWRLISTDSRVKPCGLGARDTLRLEASLALYGHELDDDTSPIEARLGFAVAREGAYLGSDWIREQREEGPGKLLVMIEMIDRAIPRQGYEILSSEDRIIGEVTSGSLAPWLNKQIGMGYVSAEHARIGSEIGIRVRDKIMKAVQVKRPFYKRPAR